MQRKIEWYSLSANLQQLPPEIALGRTGEARRAMEIACAGVGAAKLEAAAMRREADAVVREADRAYVESIRCLAATIDLVWGEPLRALLAHVSSPPSDLGRILWELAQGEEDLYDVTRRVLGCLAETSKFRQHGHGICLRIRLTRDGETLEFSLTHHPYDPADQNERLALQAIGWYVEELQRQTGIRITVRLR